MIICDGGRAIMEKQWRLIWTFIHLLYLDGNLNSYMLLLLVRIQHIMTFVGRQLYRHILAMMHNSYIAFSKRMYTVKCAPFSRFIISPDAPPRTQL